jgi:hypothetical protein
MDDPLVMMRKKLGQLVTPVVIAGLALAACGSDGGAVPEMGSRVVVSDPAGAVVDDASDKVTPPATITVDLGDDPLAIGESATVVVTVSADGALYEPASYQLVIGGVGVAEIIEEQHTIDPASINAGGQSFETELLIAGSGDGEIIARLVAVDADGAELWGSADHMQLLADPDGVFVGRAGLLALQEQQLRRDLDRGRLNQQDFDDLLTELRGGGATGEITVVEG